MAFMWLMYLRCKYICCTYCSVFVVYFLTVTILLRASFGGGGGGGGGGAGGPLGNLVHPLGDLTLQN